MSNNSKQSKNSRQEDLQSKITAKHRRDQILVLLAEWSSDMHRMTSMEEYNQNIEMLWECFLTSDYADDGEARRDIFLLIQKLKILFSGLEGKTHEDFREVDKWILKQTA